MQDIRRFLTQCCFWQVVVATVLSLGMLFTAHIVNGYWHRFMLWNLVLAWVPYSMSLYIVWLRRNRPGHISKLVMPTILWVLFFPNAPYPITDFVHMQFDPYPVWFDVAIIAAFAWTGLLLALVSLRLMQSVVREWVSPVIGWAMVGGILLLAGLGIYLGRILRWNSWDVLVHPRSIASRLFEGLVNPFKHGRAVGTTAVFATFLLLCYVSFITARPRGETDL